MFTGDPAKNKKQAEKNAALSAWLSLKQLAQQDASLSSEHENNDEQEQIRIARALHKYGLKEKIETVPIPFQNKFSIPSPRSSSPQHPTVSASKILPLFAQKTAARYRSSDVGTTHLPRLPVCQTAPYVPIRQCRPVYQSIAQPVTLRTSVPVFSAPPSGMPARVVQPRPVFIRQAVPVLASSPGTEDDPCYVRTAFAPSKKLLAEPCENVSESVCNVDESTVVKCALNILRYSPIK